MPTPHGVRTEPLTPGNSTEWTSGGKQPSRRIAALASASSSACRSPFCASSTPPTRSSGIDHDRREAAEQAHRGLGVGELVGVPLALFDQERGRAGGAAGHDVERAAERAAADLLGAAEGDGHVPQAQLVGGGLEEVGFLARRLDQRDGRVGAGDRQGEAGHAAAAAEVGEGELAGREVGQQGEGVGDVARLGVGAAGDAGEVHALVGREEQVEVAAELVGLPPVERATGAGGEVVPEVAHAAPDLPGRGSICRAVG